MLCDNLEDEMRRETWSWNDNCVEAIWKVLDAGRKIAVQEFPVIWADAKIGSRM